VLKSLYVLQKPTPGVSSLHALDELQDALESRGFEEGDIRWETEYFRDEFLKGYLSFNNDKVEELESHFGSLASSVARHPRGFMHRDFQSQNLMIKEEELWQIDFQGARVGSIYYDLASVLWDPYVELSLSEVEGYFDEYSELAGWDKKRAWQGFLEASLQRLMQALGAYSFLSLKKGKSEFKVWVEPGIRQLRQVLEICEWSGRDLLLELWD
jgi:aminoglycoside/choline kinase family phosphotransferase